MLSRAHRYAAVAACLLAGAAQAEPPAKSSGASHERPPRSAAPRSSADAPRRIFPAGERGPNAALDRLRQHGRLPANGVRTEGRTARARERAFDAALRSPEIAEDKVREKMKELQEHAEEMRRERRRALHARWGETALSAAGKAELERHGRNLASIRRLQYLVATERKGEERAALLERLTRLRNLERGRHDRAMNALKGAPEVSHGTGPSEDSKAAARKGGEP
jgi:hypothetical protein